MRVTIKDPSGRIRYEASLDDGADPKAKVRFLHLAIKEFAFAHEQTPSALETVFEARMTQHGGDRSLSEAFALKSKRDRDD